MYNISAHMVVSLDFNSSTSQVHERLFWVHITQCWLWNFLEHVLMRYIRHGRWAIRREKHAQNNPCVFILRQLKEAMHVKMPGFIAQKKDLWPIKCMWEMSGGSCDPLDEKTYWLSNSTNSYAIMPKPQIIGFKYIWICTWILECSNYQYDVH